MPVQKPGTGQGQNAPAKPKQIFKPSGLTDEELAAWCINKNDYFEIAFMRPEDRTEAQQLELWNKATEYRDWHRFQDIMNGDILYNPAIHKSKIFKGC